MLVEGKKIVAIGPNLHAGNAAEIDARGRIVMPGFIDTHHHQFETALRSFLANGILINDGSGSPSADPTYYEYILLKFAPVYRPQDVYISELFGGLAQLDDGVTTVHDVSQIHHSPQHSDAAIKALFDTGRRAAFGYFESAGPASEPISRRRDPHQAAMVLLERSARPHDHGRRGLPGRTDVHPGLADRPRARPADRGAYPVAVRHSPDHGRPRAGTGGVNNNIGIGPDNLFIHMTGMSDFAWQKVKEKGAQVSLAFPIEMNMRHGIPPILKMQSLGIEPSLLETSRSP